MKKEYSSNEKMLKNFISCFNSLKFLLLYDLKNEDYKYFRNIKNIMLILDEIDFINQNIIKNDKDLNPELIFEYEILYFNVFKKLKYNLNIIDKNRFLIDYDFIENISLIHYCIEDILNLLKTIELKDEISIVKKEKIEEMYKIYKNKFEYQEIFLYYFKQNIMTEFNLESNIN